MKPDFSKIGAVTAGKTRTTGISPFSELEISKVYPNPDQPRKQFDDIEELASTIKEHGLLQPITVVKKDDGYMIISGERRYKAHLHNEAKTIKAHIIDVTPEAVEELTLIENIQRNDLTDFELAKHICKLWDSGRYEKKSDLAARIGKKDSFVSKSFNCLKLDSEIIDHIEQNKTPISIGVMDEIARVKDKDTQKEIFEKYNNGEITRDDIKEFKEPKSLKQKLDYAEKYNLIYDEKKDWYKIPEKNQTKPINHTLERFENADNDLVEQAKTFTENFPREKSFSEQLDEANKLENKFTQLINDGYRDYNSEIKINNEYERIIYRLILQKSPKEVDNKVNKINSCISNKDGYTQKSSEKRIYLSSDKCSTTLDNRYDEIIFDLLKENLELKKEIEELKELADLPSLLTKSEVPKKDDEPKEIKLLELNENDVYVEYMDNESEHISYNKAKSLIKNSKKEYIKYENCGSEKACNFLNTLPKDILKTGVYLKKQYKF